MSYVASVGPQSCIPESNRPTEDVRRTPNDPQPSYRLMRKYRPGQRNRPASTGRSLMLEYTVVPLTPYPSTN